MSGPSAVYVLDAKGKLLISRNYRGDVPFGVAEKFMAKNVLDEEEVNIRPIVEEEGITYIYIKHQNLYRK
jgi:AP-1 complex subunit mu